MDYDDSKGTHRLIAVVAVKTTNVLNGSWGHWRGPAAKRKKQRQATIAAMNEQHPQRMTVPFPIEVLLRRVAPSNGLDDDALPASLKSIRDGLTDWMGLKNDRTPLIRWTYDQRRGKPREYLVEIEITQRT